MEDSTFADWRSRQLSTSVRRESPKVFYGQLSGSRAPSGEFLADEGSLGITATDCGGGLSSGMGY
jgi:hypothetical protein